MNNGRKLFKELNERLNVTGNNIKTYRQKNKISRQELSNKLLIIGIDISPQAIYDLENGNRTIVDYELASIAKILNVTANELLMNFNTFLDKQKWNL